MYRFAPLVAVLFVAVSCSSASNDSDVTPTTPETTNGSAAAITPTTAPIAVQITEDEIYSLGTPGPDDDAIATQKLDVYAPTKPGSWPVVAMIHGFSGSKADLSRLAIAVADRGAVVYVADYREQRPSTAAPELACLARFISATAEEYGGDPDRATLVGWSFGAMTGVVHALGGDGPLPAECTSQAESVVYDTFVGIAGAYSEGEDTLSGDPDAPSVIDPDLTNSEFRAYFTPGGLLGLNISLHIHLVHGDQDEDVPPQDSQDFYASLSRAGYDAAITVIEADHFAPVFLAWNEAGTLLPSQDIEAGWTTVDIITSEG